MPFLGTIVNFLTVLACGLIGLLLKKGIPNRVAESIKSAMAVCVIYIGISGAMDVAPLIGSNMLSDGLIKILVIVISLAIGTLIGEIIDIDKWVNRLGEVIEKRFVKNTDTGSFAEGFVHCSLLFCVGAMTINGALLDANCQPDLLITKSVIDGIMCLILAPTLGIGCAASSVFVLVYQGLLTLGALFISGILPEASISYMSATGSLIVVLIGTNMLGATKVKTANMTPAIFLPALIGSLILSIIS
jgi:uncharacterized membrane protein YqgA involved in biofilm formation